jgi:hypothetical protein
MIPFIQWWTIIAISLTSGSSYLQSHHQNGWITCFCNQNTNNQIVSKTKTYDIHSRNVGWWYGSELQSCPIRTFQTQCSVYQSSYIHILEKNGMQQQSFLAAGEYPLPTVSSDITFQEVTPTYDDDYYIPWKTPIYSSSSFEAYDSHELTVETENDVNSISKNGIKYHDVWEGIELLYPTQELDQRNAVSRTDGYWRYIQNGIMEPPIDLTYGEFDFYFFAQLLDHSLQFYHTNVRNNEQRTSHARTIRKNDSFNWDSKVFVDIGSGTGRLVLSAAGLHPNLKCSRGIELLDGIHQVAIKNLEKCRCPDDDDKNHGSDPYQKQHPNKNTMKRTMKKYQLSETIPISPVELICGNIADTNVAPIHDADIIFTFSSCMTTELLQKIANAIGIQCRPGTIVITTDYPLPLYGTVHESPSSTASTFHDSTTSKCDPTKLYYHIELVDQVNGTCWTTGGISTAYIHRVVHSCWKQELEKKT